MSFENYEKKFVSGIKLLFKFFRYLPSYISFDISVVSGWYLVCQQLELNSLNSLILISILALSWHNFWTSLKLFELKKLKILPLALIVFLVIHSNLGRWWKKICYCDVIFWITIVLADHSSLLHWDHVVSSQWIHLYFLVDTLNHQCFLMLLFWFLMFHSFHHQEDLQESFCFIIFYEMILVQDDFQSILLKFAMHLDELMANKYKFLWSH